MMKKMAVLLGAVMVLFGCSSSTPETKSSSSEPDNQLMQKAKEAIVEKEFEKAEGFVDLALENNKNDEEAKTFQKQLDYYTDGLSKKENNAKEAKTDFEEVIEIEDGSSQLIKYAKEEITQLESETKKETTGTTKSTEKVETTLWNQKKDSRLNDFMMSWGKTMKQDYKQYNDTNNVDLYGAKLPQDILNNQWTMAVNQNPVSIEWSTTGEGNKDYELVAVYSDADTQPYLEKHVYFFVFHNKQPQILVTQQNQGNPNNYMYFKQTENKDLADGFNSIAENE